MIAYDKNLLKNIFLVNEAEKLQKGNFITKEQLDTASGELPVLKSQDNILIRIGFFLLGAFLYSSICGVLSIFGLTYNDDYFTALLYVYALIGFAGTEFLAQQKYYGYGLDDAFILGAQLTLGAAVAMSFITGIFGIKSADVLFCMIIVTIVSLVLYLRYIHLSSILIFCLALTATLGFFIFKFIELGNVILPFVLMIYAIGMYCVSKKLLKDLTEPFYYNGFLLMKNFSLIMFYFSGNYMVVREFSAFLSGTYYELSPDVPFSLFFWGFTLVVPVLYLFFGLRNKDRILLWIGFLSFCFSIFTFRTYHHVLPAEVALTFGGLLLFAFTYFAIRKTRDNEKGITFKPDRIDNTNSLLNAEVLIIASTFNLKPEIKAEESPMEFGGGDFSGGGSGGSF
ncbi:hypothetical protein [Flavobacterium hydatis]|uniref:DUF2157 domain-containing protein n=1 Tax=Flavobacterium hydatis TaxID=991 RepID=A0A086AKA3_FLAHY|nr:hypothetical protein [Flavobacterium hydatis]KFF17117.1 hypothetical protein IW20_08895 [Flavobacterium hydatis]OXA95624.1 hypothetical protein B0A62_07710 [Flavobacterium hydatis]